MVATYSVLLARLIVLEDSLEGSFLGVRFVFFHLRFRWGWHRWRAHGPTCPRSTRRGFIPKKTWMSSRYSPEYKTQAKWRRRQNRSFLRRRSHRLQKCYFVIAATRHKPSNTCLNDMRSVWNDTRKLESIL